MLKVALRSRTSFRQFFNKSGAKTAVSEKETGLFDYAELKTPESLRELPNCVRAAATRLMKELLETSQPPNSPRKALEIVDDLSNEICKAADLAECVRQLHHDPKYRDAAEDASRDFCEIVESLNTHTGLYQKLKNSEVTDAARLDEIDKQTLTLLLDDFEQSGVHLPANQRREFVELSSDIFEAGSRFQAACDRNSPVKKIDQAKYSLPSQLYSPVSNSLDRSKRRIVYDTFYKHDDAQEANLRNLIASRDQLARLTGFESFAHRAQRNSLLGDYETARSFLWGVVEQCHEACQKELAVLVDVAAQCHQQNENETVENAMNTMVAEHDLSFLMHLYRESAYDIGKHTRETSSFFTISSILNGFSSLTERLYGVRLEERPIRSGEMWNANSIIKFEAIGENNNDLGTIYIDTSVRPEKAIGDCHYTIRCSKLLSNGEWQYPILVLSLGLQDEYASSWRTATVKPHAAETMFHELGHAMHSILGRTKYQHVAGTRCPQDFSEIPSNLMEYFFNDLRVLREVIRDQENPSRQLSVDAAATVLASRHSFTAIETVQQAAYGLYDLEVHGPIYAPKIASGSLTTTELFHTIMTIAMPDIHRNPDSAFQHRFHHSVQYGAKYYSYLVARASASLIWQKRFQNEPFSRKWGECWAEVQSYGGGLHPSILLEKILGSKLSSIDLTTALSKETRLLANLDAVTV
ncbi:unnamed protein product [Caenorhabditis bovis]|uniref:Peptidase M3A/M3B catalytic domain-containing protein n=1 Tax=Caenorhabditis bovis TaxID=2654633 RepID=A0A8S1FDS0_9PELO|nr:unnamed protein product [Caenorhabditis bovis]